MFNSDEWLEIGKIVAPQGLRGEMRVYPNTDFPERFLNPGERWLLREGQQELEPVTLLNGRFLQGKGLYVIQLEGITHRDQVEPLRNSRMWVPASDRPTLEEGEFHVADLIGLSVYHHTTGEQIGIVKDILPAGNDLLEVERIGGRSEHSGVQNERTQPEPAVPTPTARRKKTKPKSKGHPPTVLIPFVYEIVPIVDLENQRIEIVPPPGLIDL